MPTKSSTISLADIRKNFLYLFITDLVQIPFKSFSEYEANESGYAAPFFKAYLEAFNTPSDNVLNEEFIRRIHSISSKHLNTTKCGQYRTEKIMFSISNEIRRIPGQGDSVVLSASYNVTAEGLKSFIDKWLLKPQKPMHQLHIYPKEKCLDSKEYIITAFTINDPLSIGTMRHTNNGMEVESIEQYDNEQFLPMILDLLENNEYQFEIAVNGMVNLPNLQRVLQSTLSAILFVGQRDIAAANNDDDKISAIANLIQQINQLHPFADANIRTCYVLLNKLLYDNNMPLCIFMNPNRLDACDLEEVIRSIREGQNIFQQWLNNSSDNFIINLDKKFCNEYSLSCPPVLINTEVTNQLFRLIMNNYQQRARLSISEQSLFSNGEHQRIDGIKADIISDITQMNQQQQTSLLAAINDNNFSLLLRRACAYGAYTAITKIVNNRDLLNIEFNEQSKNNNTALDWIEKLPESSQREESIQLLIDNGALRGEELATSACDTKTI